MSEAAFQEGFTLGDASRAFREYLKADDSHRMTWIYFIQSGEDGPIKIGTARWPFERLSTLQTGNATDLRLIGVYRGLPFEEKQIQEEFRSARIRGEWFRPSSDLLEYVAAITDPLDWARKEDEEE